MFCKYCGTELSDGIVFCGRCGKNINVNMVTGEVKSSNNFAYKFLQKWCKNNDIEDCEAILLNSGLITEYRGFRQEYKRLLIKEIIEKVRK